MRHARRFLVSAALAAPIAAQLLAHPAEPAVSDSSTLGFATVGAPLSPDRAPLVSFDQLQSTLSPVQLKAAAPLIRLTDNPEAVKAAKQRTADSAARAGAALGPTARATVINQPGLQATDEGGCCTPPDTTGAIGPLHYVEPVNSLIAVYERTALGEIARANLNDFVGAPGSNTFDPQIIFDSVGARWYYAADVGNSTLGLGWSKTADPSDLLNGWCNFFIDTGTFFDDFPKLGGDDNYFFIGTNVFSGPTFVTSTIWAIPKPAVGDPSCSVPSAAFFFGSPASPLRNPDLSRAFTPVPANSAESNPTGFIVSAHHNSFPENRIALWHIEMQPDGSPLLFADADILVGAFSPPPDAPQPGTPFRIDTSDARLSQAVALTDPDAAAPALWTQHAIAGGGGSVVRWYELLPVTFVLRQQGAVSSAQDFVFNGAISPSSNGNSAAVFYNRTNASTFPSLGAQSRTSATPLGMMDPGELLLGTSDSAQRDFSCNSPLGASCRWGDYAGATPDSATAGVVWGTGELLGLPSGTSAHWKTRNYAVSP